MGTSSLNFVLFINNRVVRLVYKTEIMGCCNAKENEEGTYDPSPFTRLLGTHSSTKYEKQSYAETYSGDKPILVCCTDEGKMKMTNGKTFNTGNHPIEMLLPMMHMRDAGFSFDIATENGNSVVLEMWAYPNKDDNVKEFHESIRSMMNRQRDYQIFKIWTAMQPFSFQADTAQCSICPSLYRWVNC